MALYNAFISYSHTDCKDIAAPIQRALQNIGKPWYKELSTNLRMYRDQTDLSASPGFWPNIEAALHNSEYFILLASPLAANSGWIKKEVDVWISKSYSEKEGLKNIFIVVCGGEIAWDENTINFDWDKTNCIPRELSNMFKYEPLWIDLRNYIEINETKNRIIRYNDFGFSEQIAKIIGGIIGKAPAEIISKELQRVKKLRNIYVATGIILVILLIVATSLFIGQRNLNVALKSEQHVSDSLKTLAENQRDTAINNLKKFKIEEFQRNIRNGRIFMDAKEYCLAKKVFESADSTAKNNRYKNLPLIIKDTGFINFSLAICNKIECPK
jgi:anti-sigma28 factor (negative regulator of flagellin synthesis)